MAQLVKQLVLLLGLTAFCLAAPRTQNAPSVPACSSPACKVAAAYIADAMNATANPCNDFYEFACGGWQTRHTIPDDKSRTGTFDALNDEMSAQINELLEAYNVTQSHPKSSASVAYGAYVYQKCKALGAEREDTDALEQLKAIVREVIGVWPIGQGQRAQADRPWAENLVAAFTAGLTAVFQFSIQPDPKNVTVNRVVLDPAAQGLGDKELQNLTANAKEVAAYKAYIRASAKFFCGSNCPTLEEDIEDIVKLESALASAKLSVEQQRDPETIYNRLTFAELTKKTNYHFLRHILHPLVKAAGFTPTIAPEDELIVSDVNYTISAISTLNALKSPDRAMANYIGWRVVSALGPYSSESFRANLFTFHQTTQGVKKIANRSEACYNLANDKVSFALSRLYVDAHFTIAEKEEATKVIDSIQGSFRKLISTNTWLDEPTRVASLSKLNHIRKNVAYPAWLTDDAQLDEFYFLINKTEVSGMLTEKNYLKTLLTFEREQLRRSLVYVARPVDVNKRWPMPPAIINAAYEPEQNSITIPAGILKGPFFNGERPFALNHGSIGVVIGHELTHGFDDEGRQYDEQGNLKNWWTPEAIKHFSERSKCFVEEYGRQVEKTTGLHLNGQNTLGENIADNGGLHESFKAYKNREATSGPSPTLADLSKFTSDQLFFISYANTWCSLTRPEKLKQQIEYDPHSPAQYRVNVPLSNSADFAAAFSCPAGSPMNPAGKCLLW